MPAAVRGQVAPAVRQLRDALSTTASGVKQRYGIDWGWGNSDS